MNETRAADVVVVGLGAVGSSIAHHLARRGATVVGIDRFHPPHEEGSSHGATRITRLAIGEGAEYVPLARRSHELWRELEALTGRELMLTTGGLVIASPAADTLILHGQRGFFERTLAAALQEAIEHEVLTADEISRRYPAFGLDGDEIGYFESESGILRPEACVTAQLEAAARCGASLLYDERVETFESSASGVRLRTHRGTVVKAGQVIIATGAWLPGMLGGAWNARLAIQRQVLHWFATERPELYRPEALPVFMFLHGGEGHEFYGFPMVDQHRGVKVATEQVTETTTPDHVERRVDSSESEAMYRLHVAGRLRGVRNAVVHASSCLYVSNADGRFVFDRDPVRPNVAIVSACSGHGFKHSAALGEAIAATLLGECPRINLSPFSLAAQRWGA